MKCLCWSWRVSWWRATSRVALESVDFDESEERFGGMAILAGFEEVVGFGGAGDDFLMEASLSDSLEDELEDELSEDDEVEAIFLVVIVSVGFAATSGIFFSFVIPIAEAVFAESPFDFFAGGEGSCSDASDSELELEDESELALRFKLLMRPLTVGLVGLTFAPGASFSSSASLSELELEDDADGCIASTAFFVGFDAGLAFLVCLSKSLSSLRSLLPLLDVSSCAAFFSVFFDPLLFPFFEPSESSSPLELEVSSDSEAC